MRNWFLVIAGSVLFWTSTVAESAEVEWAVSLGDSLNEGAQGVALAPDGGYVVVGWTHSYGAVAVDMYLVKTNADGVEEWHQTYGGTRGDIGYDVQSTADGGYILVGATESSPSTDLDVFLVKVDSLGNEEWTQHLGGSNSQVGFAVQQTSDGGYIVAGETSFPVGPSDEFMGMYVLRADASGGFLWSKTYGGGEADQARAVQQTADGGFIVSGTVLSPDYDVVGVKTDSTGTQEWLRQYGDSSQLDNGYGVAELVDGGFAFAGYAARSAPEFTQMFLVRTNAAGDTLWTRHYGGTSTDVAFAMDVASDGGFVLGGYSTSFGDTDGDFYALRTNSVGDTLWTCNVAHPRREWAYDVAATPDGGCILAGIIAPPAPSASDDVFLVKIGVTTVTVNDRPHGMIPLTLHQNSPNPFRGSTELRYKLSAPATVVLSVYDVRGQLVRRLYEGQQVSGEAAVLWDGTDSHGRAVGPGIYFYRLTSRGHTVTRKSVLLR